MQASQWRLIAVSALAIGVVAVGTWYWSSSSTPAATTREGGRQAKGKRPAAAAAASAKEQTLDMEAVEASSDGVAGGEEGEASASASASGLEDSLSSSSSAAAPAAAAPVTSAKGTPEIETDMDKLSFRAPAASQAAYDRSLFATNVPASERAALAQRAKNAGNEFYKRKAFAEAYDMYSQAIRLKPDAVYFSNRAACLANMEEYEGAVADCTASLQLEKLYAKALNRRAHALEKLDRNAEALNDYSVVCVLEQFKQEATLAATDRVLKKIGRALAEVEMRNKKSRLPSPTFIAAYMDSFHLTTPAGAKEVVSIPCPGVSDKLVRDAFIAIDTRNWTVAMARVTEALEQGAFSSPEWEALAHNLSGTFHFLMGKIAEAGEAFERSAALNPKLIDTAIKRASVCMERGDVNGTLEQLQLAEGINSNTPDLYYHRGQVRFVTGDLAGAADDYRMAIKLDSSFVYAYIQLGVSLYKLEDQEGAMAILSKAVKRFEGNAEIYNYFGEILLDMRQFDKALANFDKSISLNPSSPLPYINKAILYLGMRNDPVEAEKFCRKAIAADPMCDIAYTQLAQLLLQQNKVEEAVENYNRAVEVTRTETELVNAITCREAAVAQLYVIRTYPDIVKMLHQ